MYVCSLISWSYTFNRCWLYMWEAYYHVIVIADCGFGRGNLNSNQCKSLDQIQLLLFLDTNSFVCTHSVTLLYQDMSLLPVNMLSLFNLLKVYCFLRLWIIIASTHTNGERCRCLCIAQFILFTYHGLLNFLGL